VLTSRFASKAGVVAQLAGLAVATGALVAAVVIPAVGVAGIATRNAATKFNTMATPELGQIPVRSEILDRHGHVLAYYYARGIDRVPVTYAQIAPVMRQAIVAIEDSRFYQHGAIDFKGTVRAVINNLEHQPVQGGSTLAQQYVKNVLYLSAPNPQAAFAGATSETLGRKVRELRMAARVEHTMSKNQILAGYLNAAYFGSSAYGIEVAAQRYFSTDASKLTLPQAALLAGLVENPTAYDPINYPKEATARRDQVLQRMVQVGDITQAQADAAGKQPLGLNPSMPQKGCTSSSAGCTSCPSPFGCIGIVRSNFLFDLFLFGTLRSGRWSFRIDSGLLLSGGVTFALVLELLVWSLATPSEYKYPDVFRGRPGRSCGSGGRRLLGGCGSRRTLCK